MSSQWNNKNFIKKIHFVSKSKRDRLTRWGNTLGYTIYRWGNTLGYTMYRWTLYYCITLHCIIVLKANFEFTIEKLNWTKEQAILWTIRSILFYENKKIGCSF